MIASDFEHRLIDALQPVRQWALASCIYHLFDTGLYDALADADGRTTDELTTALGMDPRKLRGFLAYLRNEGLVAELDGRFTLTASARDMAEFRPWYTLLVGGYAETFQQLGDKLGAGAGWATRDGSRVGTGSCGISQYDAIPLSRKLIAAIPTSVDTVVDLGCGDGQYLVRLCEQEPGLSAIGVDPDARTVELARELIAREGLRDRIDVRQGTATSFAAEDDELTDRTCFIAAFVLQEVLEQQGEDGLRSTLVQLFDRAPEAHLVVVEVDHRPDDPQIMAHGLGLAYYNPYYLLHHLTEQRLETTAFWDRMFESAGLRVVDRAHADERVDSTRLEIGYLLAKDNRS